MVMNKDDVFAAMLIFIVVACLGTFLYNVSTDEYMVEAREKCIEYSTKTGECVENKEYFVCKVEHGEDLLRCETYNECRDHCDKVRKGLLGANRVNTK
jgi:hypothetical protein